MPEPQQIRDAINAGARSTRDLAQACNVSPSAINKTLNQMPDGDQMRARLTAPINRSTRPLIEYGGEIKTPAAWARDERVTVSGTLISQRLNYGWPVEDALFRPVQYGRGQVSTPLTALDIAAIRVYAEHYTQDPPPHGLAQLTADLLRGGASVSAIARVADHQQSYTVQLWASHAGYIAPYLLDQHQKIRDAIKAGAATMKDVADAFGTGRERIRQLMLSMPDRDELVKVLHTNVSGVPSQRRRGARTLTDKELAKLLHLQEAANEPREGASKDVNRAVEQRDTYARALRDAGVAAQNIADACEVTLATVHRWTSPSKQYRRALRNKRGSKRR